MTQKILRREDVERITGLKCSSIYAKMAAGEFPKPIRLSARSVGWLENEVQAWTDARIAERDAQAGA